MGVWLLVAHFFDMQWMVLPSLHTEFHPHWLDVAAPTFIGGASLLVVLVRSRREPEMPLHDPRLASGLEYEAS
jgi:hypothetical protein